MLIREDSAFEPEAVERLNRAFQRAWGFVQRSGDADPTAEEHSRASIALHIMAIAGTKRTSRDCDRESAFEGEADIDKV